MMDIRQPIHSSHAKTLDTAALRQEFLIENLFTPDHLHMTYSHIDRIIAFGVNPITTPVEIPHSVGQQIGVSYFLERRELGIINIGGSGNIIVDGQEYDLNFQEGLYIGMKSKNISFTSYDPNNPAKFYCNSAPAHKEYPTVKVTLKEASPEILGEQENCNRRTIYKYIHPSVLESCQLLMGLTRLESGSVWNTMPCHLHDRRMEIYFYFEIPKDNAVFHFMGEPQETRHITMRNEQAVISPSWSIHSGVGSCNYSFIWGMVGENQEFSDMDFIPMGQVY